MSMRADGAAAGKQAAAHAVFFPFPGQGHVGAALQLAKLLHARHGVRITFVHTDRNSRRILRSRGPAALAGAPGFAFASVPDGLPSGEDDDDDGPDSTQRIVALLSAIEASVPHLEKLLDGAADSGAGAPPATCVVSNIECVLLATRKAGLPAVAFWTTSACGFMAGLQTRNLIDKGLIPLKAEEQLRNGYLDRTLVDWVPGFPPDMRLRDFLSFVRTTDPNDPMLGAYLTSMEALRTTPSAIILNTFDDLEGEVVGALSAILLPPVFAVGPLPLLAEQHVAGGGGASLTREDDGCLAWLGTKRPRSVVYANFGSIVVLTSQQLTELAWGLADSGYDFLLVTRDNDDDNDQANGGSVLTSPEFVEATRERCYVASWCRQTAVLRHEAVGAFVTHCGWNSTLESICAGVPMLCWPFGADQQTNCRFACTEWRVGTEVSNGDVRRAEVERQVRAVMGGEEGRELRRRATEWKERAAAASAEPGGSSWVNLERLVSQVFQP